jgi:MFS family permease
MIVIGLVLANVLSNSWYSLIVPFLPLELKKWGIDMAMIGYIFAIYSIAIIIGSPIVGKALTTIGRKRILIGGLWSMGCAMIGFGATDLLPNKSLFTFFIFLFRFLQGCSSCAIQTTSYAVISMSFPEEQEKYIAVMQVAIGTGLIIGPVNGTILYTLLGFSNTFFLIGICFLFLTFLLSFFVPSSIDKKDEHVETIIERRISQYEENMKYEVNETVSFWKLIITPTFILAGMGGLFSMLIFSYMEPVLAFRLQEFKINPVLIGIFFSIQPVSYVVLSFGITILTGKFANRGIMMTGAFLGFFGLMLVGPSHYLPDRIEIMCIGQLAIGALGLFLMVPAIPEMINAAGKLYPHKIIEITDISAGVFNCFLGTGQVIGPIIGSTLTALTDFRTCSDIIGMIWMGYFAIYFIFGNGFSLLRSGWKEKKKEIIDIVRNSPSRNMHMRSRLFSNQTHDENFDLNTLKLLRHESLLEKDEV